jgi:predicted enzyme related to lactoylglutathione lyase
LIKGKESQFRLRSIALRWGKANMGKSDGRFVWYELATTDIEKAKAFYSAVVGWRAADVAMPGSTYALFITGGTPVAGLAQLQPGAQKAGVSPQWMGYVEVGDVDAVARRVKKLGGTMHIPPTDIRNVSRFSVFADPQMATLALIKAHEAREQLPAQPNAAGYVVWRELLASDWEKAFIFYNKLFGWKKIDAPPDLTGGYQEFAAGTERVGGMFNHPDAGGFSFWLYYFSVGDIEASVKEVVGRGGKVIYGPVTVPGAARIVHCRDPQGSVFGLMDRRVRITIGCYSPRDPGNKQ